MIVDDSEPWRRLVRSILRKHPEVQVVGEVSDGPEAVQQARELQPDLILLDIGLPTLNGIEAARQIRRHSPSSKILFLSQETSVAVVQEALGSGKGYVTKADAARDLPAALNAVLRDESFVGNRFSADILTGVEIGDVSRADDRVPPSPVRNGRTTSRHEVGFYSDDQLLLDDAAEFIGSALKAGNATVVVLTENHRNSLRSRLQAYGVNIEVAIEQNRYLAFDAAEALKEIMRDDMPDPARFLGAFGNAIQSAANAVIDASKRVVVFGECVHLLWAQGNPEAAIRMEQLANELLKTHDADVRCSYCLADVPGGMDDNLFRRICAEHSAVHTRTQARSLC